MQNRIDNMAMDEFAKLDSDICVALKEENKDYRRLHREMTAIMASYPALRKLLDQDQPIALSQEEADALQSYRKLQMQAEDIERYALYRQGYRDCLTYMDAKQ